MHRFEQFKPVILAARSEEHLVKTMRQFCELFDRSELAPLPEECRECNVRSAEDIDNMAVAMRSCELRYSDPALLSHLKVLARAFVLASEQLRRIRPSPFDVGGENPKR